MSTTTTTPTVPNAITTPPSLDDSRRRLDWRMRLANDLAMTATEEPVHEDVWVQDAARLFYHTRIKDTRYTPGLRQRCIIEAARLHQTGALTLEALEARLLTRLSFDRIANVCPYPAAVIEAYEAMFFAIRDRAGRDRWVMVGLHQTLCGRDRTICQIGTCLKQFALYYGQYELKSAIYYLSHLEGPTLADGLDGSGLPEYEDEVFFRIRLGECLMTSGRRAQQFRECFARYQQECRADMGPEVPAVIELLRSVKLSKTVLAQCRELRRRGPRRARVTGKAKRIKNVTS